MPRNKMTDLTNHLFEQLERLNDEGLDEDVIESEVKRAKAMSQLAGEIIKANKLAFDVLKNSDKLPTEFKGSFLLKKDV